MSPRKAVGMSAADFMSSLGGGTRAARLAEYDRMLARLDGEIAIVKTAPSLDVALATLSPKSEELP